ncbi:hypothetical protein DEJ50_15400 [Streptomyces venezuelae]|uniref:Uncharacterized protein n=1 Tax=Streptomyces venezuelae TaxID=54571 RepID=A0A5P2D1S4_STRVZ|nr:hypothetical protein [Streptomyces venezuelae]QES48996.1 hypothetical protein DEJ50_15400 [Streptomyces venezuelae]
MSMSTRTGLSSAPRGLRAVWTAAHTPVAGVPRWATNLAYTVPFLVLPSGLWRIVTVLFGDGRNQDAGQLPSWLPVEAYVVLLSVASELLAFTAVGLIAAWGEVFPRWIPGLGGRRVPTSAAVIPAAFGTLALTAVWTTIGLATEIAGTTIQGDPLPAGYPGLGHGWSLVFFYATYAPLVLWGPALGVLTVAYWKRRRRNGP